MKFRVLLLMLCVLPLIASAGKAGNASTPPEYSKPHSNPSNAKTQPTKGGRADMAFKQSAFGHDLVNKVKKGAIYIWAMSPDKVAGVLEPAWIGSGFIFQSDPQENAAYALTNHHVANDATMLQCETYDHNTYRADFVALEPGIDVALIKIYNIPPSSYEVNVLGDSDKVQIGEPALAIGAPGSRDSLNSDRSDPEISFGLHQTATMRVVAGKETNAMDMVDWWSSLREDLGYEMMTNLPWRFMVQSAINGGNSGGPLYNSNGEVIGLNHGHSGGPWTQNENYTIPINFAKNFAYQILNTGKYEVPWFGMDVLIPPNFTEGQQISEWGEHYDPHKLEVLGVRADSPAKTAGLQRGDKIVDFDGQTFPTSSELRLYILNLPIGKKVPITVKRGGAKVHLTLETGVKRKYDSEFSL